MVSAGDSFFIQNRTLDLHRFGNSGHAGPDTRDGNHAVASGARRSARDHFLRSSMDNVSRCGERLIAAPRKWCAGRESAYLFSNSPHSRSKRCTRSPTTFMYSAAEDLAGQDDVNDVIFTEPIEV